MEFASNGCWYCQCCQMLSRNQRRRHRVVTWILRTVLIFLQEVHIDIKSFLLKYVRTIHVFVVFVDSNYRLDYFASFFFYNVELYISIVLILNNVFWLFNCPHDAKDIIFTFAWSRFACTFVWRGLLVWVDLCVEPMCFI